MKWHSFNISKFINWSLPIALRRLKLVLFLYALTMPLRWLIANVLYKMQHDCRVIYIEKVLNEAFAMPGYDHQNHEATKVIYIGDGNIPDEVYIFQEEEPDEPVWLDDDEVYLFTQEELDEQYTDFTVVAPLSLQPQENRIKRLVDYFKMAGKKYKIEYV